MRELFANLLGLAYGELPVGESLDEVNDLLFLFYGQAEIANTLFEWMEDSAAYSKQGET